MDLGLIGVGRWGKRYIETLKQIPGAQLAWVASTNPETSSLVPQAKIFKDWNDLLRAKPDGLIVATPPSTHGDILRAALQAQIPTLMEKPLCLNAREAQELETLATSSRVPVLMDHTHLFHPAYEALKKQATEMGAIRYIRSEGMAFGPFRKDEPVLWDWTPHDVYLCLDLIGRTPKEIKGVGDDHTVALTLDFGSGCSAWITNSNFSLEKRRRFTVHFEGEEILAFEDRKESPLTKGRAGAMVSLPTESGFPLTRAVEYFLRGLTGGDTSRFGLKLATQTVAVLESAQKAIRTGRPSQRDPS